MVRLSHCQGGGKKVLVALKCPFGGSTNVGKNGTNNGKQRYICKNSECLHKTFYAEYTYNACKPGVKSDIHRQTVNVLGIRAISCWLDISTNTVIAELKKRSRRNQRQHGILSNPQTRSIPHRNGRDVEFQKHQI
ncbi:MAG: hypothetical protein LBU65_11115 [Planctomycetaceae bacterium]|nr:hypothetical protein [Planctomycetaceae bacterium]